MATDIIARAMAAKNNGQNADLSDLNEQVNNLATDVAENSNNCEQMETKLTSLEETVCNYHDTVIYGYHVNPNIEDSSNAVTYLIDAVGMTPAKMNADEFNYGSWGNAFFIPKPCMLNYNGTVAYYLDPNDYSKKLDGTPSDISNPDFEGNAMMEWGLIWYKFVGGTENGEGYFYVSNKKVDDSYNCWCNYDSNNNIIPHFYTAIYNSTLHNGKFRSLSGLALTKENGSGYTTGEQEVTYCTANNTTDKVEWYTDVYSDRILINALLVLMGKSLNTQFVFGRGLDSGEKSAKESYITGSLNNKGLFYGTTANGNSAVKTFGMENWWGCAYHRTSGCIMAEYDCKVKLTYGTVDGTTVNGYNSTGDGYVPIGTVPSTNGYIKKFKYGEKGYMPFEIGGSDATYYGDYYYQNPRNTYLVVGAAADGGTNAGAFCFNFGVGFMYSDWNVTTNLSCKPVLSYEPFEVYTKAETDAKITEKVAEIVADAPEDFDTLKEMSDWIANHEQSAAAMNSAILKNTNDISDLDSNKVDKVSGKQLSTNDYTNEDKAKLAGAVNYDDTEVKAEIAEISSQAALNCSTLGYQRKNLLQNTATSQTFNGLTFTVNDDGSVTISGTATKNTFYALNRNFPVGDKDMILSGCPVGGGISSYQLDILDGSSGDIVVADTGSGAVFNKTKVTSGNATVRIRIQANTAMDNLVFRPMLRYAEITDDTYEPYKPSVEERLVALEEKIAALEGGAT